MYRYNKYFLSLSIILFINAFTYAQTAKLGGIISSVDGEKMFSASVVVTNKNIATVSDPEGKYSLNIPADEILFIKCSFVGYESIHDTITAQPGTTITRNYILHETMDELEPVVVVGTKNRENTLVMVDMKSIDQLPNVSGNIETLLKSFSGVISGNELSSQYSVRGGNYDENLIYVNGIEIYRPMLVQSAQQEGLSFVNPDMVSSIQFSAGGFESEYGDKMSSVLDIKYKKPVDYEGSASASLLGGSLHFGGTDKSKRISHNTGVRYKTSQYLLSSLDVSGEYIPRFADVQSYITYDLTPKTSISLLGNYSYNRFTIIPDIRETKFGTIQRTLNFKVFYEGQEKDRFDSYMGALSLVHRPNQNLSLKFIGTSFQSDEEVSYDILSEYLISHISTGSDNNDTIINIGTGSSLEHARNYLKANIHSIEHKGLYTRIGSTTKWGFRVRYESIDDKLSEWRMLDSAKMSIPYSNEEILLDYSVAENNNLSSLRYEAYIQNLWRMYTSKYELNITLGLRGNYWDFNNNFILSPRGTFSLKPYWNKEFILYFATGLYAQPPFYKEIRDYTGRLYPNKKAQKSWHFVLGSDFHFSAWDRPFVFTTALYYKYLYDIIPYKTKNIQLNYIPEHEARGYAAGIDLRVNGEFVPGTESWFSLSLLKTRENTKDDFYINKDGTVVYPGFYRRPTDQTVTFSVFFQDYLPSNPNYKVYLLLNFGSGLPYSGPTPSLPSEIFPLKRYQRIDIGFSRIIKREKKKNIGLNDIWITAEVLNLLGNKNMASYDWIRTVENNQGYQDSYAIPNYLTDRRFNVKISTSF